MFRFVTNADFWKSLHSSWFPHWRFASVSPSGREQPRRVVVGSNWYSLPLGETHARGAAVRATFPKLLSSPHQNSRSSVRKSSTRQSLFVEFLRFLLIELGFHSGLDLFVECPIILERFLGRIAALGELSAFVIQPRTAFLDDLFFERKIEQRAGG